MYQYPRFISISNLFLRYRVIDLSISDDIPNKYTGVETDIQ
jgi:hypothetical protein